MKEHEGTKSNEADKQMKETKETKEMKEMCWPSAQAEGSRRRRCKPRSLHSKLRVFRDLAEVKYKSSLSSQGGVNTLQIAEMSRCYSFTYINLHPGRVCPESFSHHGVL